MSHYSQQWIWTDSSKSASRRQWPSASLDAREPGAVEQQGTIPGSINVRYRAIRSRNALPPLVELVVTICNSCNRSGLAASLLERLGIRVMNLDGGTSAWEDAGQSLAQSVMAAG